MAAVLALIFGGMAAGIAYALTGNFWAALFALALFGLFGASIRGPT